MKINIFQNYYQLQNLSERYKKTLAIVFEMQHSTNNKDNKIELEHSQKYVIKCQFSKILIFFFFTFISKLTKIVKSVFGTVSNSHMLRWKCIRSYSSEL